MEGYAGRKPFFDMARGAAETAYLTLPPFSFPGVTARVFPLRASMDLLCAFCRRYLNVAPPEICELRPYLPYVLLVVLDYGQGAIETANLGWVSQHEVFFAIPLEKWQRRRGRMVFDGWVLNTPFIFVDNASSLTTGREVYGWPKVLASLRPGIEEWLIDPRNPIQLLSLSVKGFGRRDAEKVPLLKIDQDLGQNPSLAPEDLLTDPFQRLSHITRGVWLGGVDLGTLFLRSPLSGFGPRRADGESPDILFGSLRQLFDFTRNPGVDVVTLKQFRDAEAPEDICYQALVGSRLSVDRFNHGGPLGLYNLLQGDITGGFRIRLYDHPCFPITSSLGLQAVQECTDCGSTVSILEPIFPFWLSVDMTYGKGENLGWRMHGLPWRVKEAVITGATKLSGSYSYNTVAGAGHQEWVGPFLMPQASYEVFPLRVHDQDRLDLFIHDYLNLGEPHSFKLWGAYVYMTVSRSRVFSQARSATFSQIAVYVPLLWYEQGRLNGIVLAKPYAFVDDPTFAMTMREVQGIPAIDATIEIPKRSWWRQGTVLRMKTDIFTVLNAGMGAERRTLIEVVQPPSAWSPPRSGSLSAGDEVELLKQAREIFGDPVKVPVLTLKQFRDASEPDRACYQALILEPWTIFGKPPQRLGIGTQLRIYQYPSLPLARTLGLVDPAQPSEQSTGKKRRAMVDVLTPEDPFRIELNITVGLAEVLSRTAGNLPWIQPQRTEPLSQKNKTERKITGRILQEGPQVAMTAFLNVASVQGLKPASGSGPAEKHAAGKRRGGKNVL